MKNTDSNIYYSALWLISNTNYKISSIASYFNLHRNTLSNWKKLLETKQIKAPDKIPFHASEFLKSPYANSKNRIYKNIDENLISEIKYIAKNYSNKYLRASIASFYELDDNYISFIKNNNVWEKVIEKKPNEERLKEILKQLENITKNIKKEIQNKKQIACWLLLNTNLELIQISHMLDLSYFHIYRLAQTKRKNEFKIEQMCENIANVNWNFNNILLEYFFRVTIK